MKMSALRTTTLAAMIALVAAPALAARGIVTAVPNAGGQGSAGSIVTTDFDATEECQAAESPDQCVCPLRGPGDAIAFTEEVGAQIGDLVGFAPVLDVNDGLLAESVTVLASGEVIDSDRQDKLNVTTGNYVLVDGATLNGRVSVSDGGILVVLGGIVGGNVKVTAGTLIVNDAGTVRGTIVAKDGAAVSIGPGGTVSGSVKSKDDCAVRIGAGSSVGGSIKSKQASLSVDPTVIVGGTISGKIRGGLGAAFDIDNPPRCLCVCTPNNNYVWDCRPEACDPKDNTICK
jgi:hypothetical protein